MKETVCHIRFTSVGPHEAILPHHLGDYWSEDGDSVKDDAYVQCFCFPRFGHTHLSFITVPRIDWCLLIYPTLYA